MNSIDKKKILNISGFLILILIIQLADCQIVFAKTKNIPKQETIKGAVTEDNGQVLPGVSIILKGSQGIGTTTDANGKFTINVPDNNAVLVFSFIGFITDSVSVNGKSVIDMVLKKNAQQLNELVVVGYGAQLKSDVTGAISSVTEKDFNRGTVISPEQLIQGKMSGVNVTSSSGEPGAALAVTIRGPGSLRSGNTPLFVVDGMPLDNSAKSPSTPDVGFGSSASPNPLNFLNPSDIQSIDVLKDASATAIYGSRGANGVVIITTKKGSAKKSGLEYSTYFGISTVAKKLDLLSTSEFVKYARDNNHPENIYDTNTSTDWQDQIFRTAKTQNHQLSLNGGADHSSYYVSLSLMDQQGLIKLNEFEEVFGQV